MGSAERGLNCQSNGRNEHQRASGRHDGHAQLVGSASERDDDEGDFEALEQHAFAGQYKPGPVRPVSRHLLFVGLSGIAGAGDAPINRLAG